MLAFWESLYYGMWGVIIATGVICTLLLFALEIISKPKWFALALAKTAAVFAAIYAAVTILPMEALIFLAGIVIVTAYVRAIIRWVNRPGYVRVRR